MSYEAPTIYQTEQVRPNTTPEAQLPTVSQENLLDAIANIRNPELLAQRIPQVGRCNNHLRNKKRHPCSYPESLGGISQDQMTEWCQTNLSDVADGQKIGRSYFKCTAEDSRGSGLALGKTFPLEYICQQRSGNWYVRSQVCATPRKYFTYY